MSQLRDDLEVESCYDKQDRSLYDEYVRRAFSGRSPWTDPRTYLLCMLGSLSGCGVPTNPTSPTPLPVEVAIVSRGVESEGFSYPARLSYDREVVLSTRIGGTVRAMPVNVGQRLKAGSLIMALDPTLYRAALARVDADARRTARDAARDASLVGAGASAEIDAKDAASIADAARATRDVAAYDLASTRLTMPFAGIILVKATDVGAVVTPGQPVVTVADLATPLIARVAIPAEAARGIRTGGSARVSVGQLNYVGHVLRVGAGAASGAVQVDVVLSAGNERLGLISGTTATARFDAVPSLQGMAGEEQHIPAEALVDSHGSTGRVFVVDSRRGVARLTRVHLLGPGDDDLRVSGLPAGARVITSGAGFVADGQRVSVLPR